MAVEHEFRARLIDLPLSTLGLMYLQLANWMDNMTEARVCAHCGQYFIVDPKSQPRVPRKYCGDGCRTLAYRGRKETALKKAKAGQSPAQIARELETTAKTVRGWIEKES